MRLSEIADALAELKRTTNRSSVREDLEFAISVIRRVARRLPDVEVEEPTGTRPGLDADREVLQVFCGLMAGNISRQIQDALKSEGMVGELGFALVVFDFGDSGGSMAYASNARRPDFLRLLDELRGKLSLMVPKAEQVPSQ